MCLLIVYEVVCPPYKTDWIGVTRLPTVLSISRLCLITKCKQIRCVLVMLLAIHMFLWTATFAAFMVTVRHALNVCKLSTYPVMQQLRKLQLSSAHFPVLLQNNIPVHFAIKQHINKSKTRVPPFLEWKPCHVFVDVHEWTSHTVTVMLHCSHDSEAPHGSQFFNRRARVIRLLWQCVDSMNDHAWRLIL